MTIGIISHPDCLLHTMGDYHPECPERLIVIEEASAQFDLNDLKHYEAPLATRDHLLRVHDKNYIDFIYQSAPRQGFVMLDPDVLMNPDSLTAALRAAGATTYGVELVMKKEVDAAFCNVRPPGHHAERQKAMGFCIFNNVAVGVMHALEQFKLKRAVIIDFDVHHGNGTEDIFKDNENVLYCSTFEHPFYPFSGAATKSEHIINIPLPAGTDGSLFRENVANKWLNRVNDFKPDIIFFSAGFDAYIDDQLADLRLIPDDYLWVTQKIKEIADTHCPGRLISALEGGYNLRALGTCAAAHIRGLL